MSGHPFPCRFPRDPAVTPGGPTRGAIVDQAYDSASDTTTATLVVGTANVQAGACNCIMLSFSNATTRAHGPGLRDIKLLQPGYTVAQADEFSAPLLSLLGRFSILRFMDWCAAPREQTVIFRSRPPPCVAQGRYKREYD